MPTGPQKLILVRSGLYEYAEVEINGAIQIVGPNNTGKSTLIKTLQFLYLNDRRQMDFAYPADQTRDFYFPDQYSYILFECLGAQGISVLGWRGQNKANSSEPERFWFSGPYEEADFFADRGQVREPHEVNNRLALKDFRAITSAQEHADTLLPPTSGHPQGLGIVALRHPDKYHHFRETLKCLLNLSVLSQEDMRHRLLMLADIPPDRTALDVRVLFGQDYVNMENRRTRLKLFKNNKESVESLVKHCTAHDTLCGELIFRYGDLKRKKQRFQQEHEDALKDLRAATHSFADEAARIEEDVKARNAQILQLSETKGGLARELEELKTLDDKFTGFLRDFATTALANVETQIAKLQGQLRDAEGASKEKAQQKLQGCHLLVAHIEELIQRFDNLTVTALREHFTDAELESIFRIVSRDLLELPIGPDGVQVKRHELALKGLRDLLSRIKDSTYEDNTVTIRLRTNTSPLSGIENVQTLRTQLSEHKENLDHWQAILAAIEHREQLQEDLRLKRAEHHRTQTEIFSFDEYVKKKAGEPGLTAELRRISTQISSLKDHVTARTAEGKAATSSRQRSEKAIEKAEAEFERVLGNFENCDYPAYDTPERPVQDIPDDFEAAVALFAHHQARENQLAEQAAELLTDLEKWAGDEFRGDSTPATIRLLQDELDALPDKQEAMTREWNAHIHGLKATFDQVLRELSEIHSAKDALNRDFAKVQVSNLKSVKMAVLEQADLLTWVKKLAAMEPGGLYDDDTERQNAVDNFRLKLQNNSIVRYADIFTLGVTVERPDGHRQTYPELKKVESDGTTVAIKVLFNLLVLRSQLKRTDCQVPFFLDEIHALDPANRHSIIAMARKLGFLAITAAPESVGEVDFLYYLQPRRGRIVLRNKHCLGIKLNSVPP